MTGMRARSRRAAVVASSVASALSAEIISAYAAGSLMPNARAQRWHPWSLAAGKYREIKGDFAKSLKSCENPGPQPILPKIS
jgi:hypothetical protein